MDETGPGAAPGPDPEPLEEPQAETASGELTGASVDSEGDGELTSESADGEGEGGEGEERQAKAPWHFKLIVVGSVVYLGYRLYQGITWLAHHV
ncbi:MAG: hypothetical protein ACLPQS_03260 [Acidimicrobiales bacterium]